ncbi:hypothetical protein E2542_SST20847 [Spatholobus suberectus]|nr:hypothetical protein E2542_SST20847 [Spatholobus suberectus]
MLALPFRFILIQIQRNHKAAAPEVTVTAGRMLGIGDKKERRTKEGETTSWELQLKKRNEELEEELKQSKGREEHVRRQLRAALDRLRVAEDAEERLCSELGDLEAEALQQARDYHARIVSLVDQLSRAHSLLNKTVKTTIPLPSPS